MNILQLFTGPKRIESMGERSLRPMVAANRIIFEKDISYRVEAHQKKE